MKKKKRVLTKQQRNAILQSLQKSNEMNLVINDDNIKPQENETNLTKPNINNKIYTNQIQIDSIGFINEIKKIALVGGIITILLIGAIIVNQKTDYLTKIGSIITKKIGL